MDAPVRIPEPGDPATLLIAGTVWHSGGEYVTVRLPGGELATAPLTEGARVIPGDIRPTLEAALERAIACLKGLTSPSAIAHLDQYERALDCVRGYVAV